MRKRFTLLSPFHTEKRNLIYHAAHRSLVFFLNFPLDAVTAVNCKWGRGTRRRNSLRGMEGELNIIDHSAQLHCFVRYKSQYCEATQNLSSVKFFRYLYFLYILLSFNTSRTVRLILFHIRNLCLFFFLYIYFENIGIARLC